MNLKELLHEQMLDVQNNFPGLALEGSDNGQYLVKGVLSFEGEYEDKIAVGDYEIEITVFHDYPENVPVTRSSDGKVPESFHTYPKDKTLCLAMPLAERITFRKTPTLIGYIKHLVIPHLFSYSYMLDHKKLPYGDLEHGSQGKLDFYKELFQTEELGVLGILRLLADDGYRGHHPCPCGSNKILRKCHGPKLLEIKECYSLENFRGDLLKILRLLSEKHSDKKCLHDISLSESKQLYAKI